MPASNDGSDRKFALTNQLDAGILWCHDELFIQNTAATGYLGARDEKFVTKISPRMGVLFCLT